MGTLAGSTIMLLTIVWGGSVLCGRCNLDEQVSRALSASGCTVRQGRSRVAQARGPQCPCVSVCQTLLTTLKIVHEATHRQQPSFSCSDVLYPVRHAITGRPYPPT
jgi:hypothetical protein